LIQKKEKNILLLWLLLQITPGLTASLLLGKSVKLGKNVFGKVGKHLDILYDVAHNIAKIEEHTVKGVKKKVLVHRKGYTRAFPAGNVELPAIYRSIGQPVLIPGSMGTASYVLVGSSSAMELSFASTCHGAGRLLSRNCCYEKNQR
jgi:RNA-splicing ligase RtcB